MFRPREQRADTFPQVLAICNPDYVSQGSCTEKQIGQFILSPNATDKANSGIVTSVVNLKDPEPIKYPIKKTGYYCIVTDPWKADKYTAVAEFRNAFGELPATQIPKLPFYGGMTIVYILLAGYWGFLYYQHRHDICKFICVFVKLVLFADLTPA